jgi:hypothetical protein
MRFFAARAPFRSGSASLGSQKDGLPARSRGEGISFKAISSRYRGQPGRCPVLVGEQMAWQEGMDGKTSDLVMLAALSLFCACLAWSWGHRVFALVFFTLCIVAVLGAAREHGDRSS